MKKIFNLLTTLVLIYSNNSVGQCVANAGPDRIICTNMFGVDTTQIGTSPAVIGGAFPYTYKWETNYTITIGTTSYTKTASDFLNDTTIATPLVIASEENPVTFVLTITDSVGNVCSDTAVIKFSLFMFTLGYLNFSITQGDSIYLNYGTNVSSNFPPFQYLWKPNQGLTDSTNLTFWAKPNISVAYYTTITDSAGCSTEAPPYYYINVNPVGINELENPFELSVYPNQAYNNSIIFELKSSANAITSSCLIITDIVGQRLNKYNITSSNTKIVASIETYPSGIYFYSVYNNGVLKKTEKFIISK